MKIIDPHVDLADFYTLNKWVAEDFLKLDSPAWVTLPKLKDSGIDVIGFTLYFDESFKKTTFYVGVKSFYGLYQKIFSESDMLVPIKSAIDFNQKASDKIGYFFAIEGFECFRTPEDFDEFYDLGVRSFGLTWSFDNDYACGRQTKFDDGISRLGLQVIEKMKKRSKLWVDIAHLSEQSVKDLEKNWPGMIVTTHGNVRNICGNSHNLTDDEISIIYEREGVVSLVPLVECIGNSGNFDDFYKHLDYIASKWGVDYIAFSTDIYPLPEYPFLNNAQDITIAKDWYEYLLTRLKPDVVEQIMWGNWARVIRTTL